MPEPPKIAQRILMRLVGGRDAQAIAGDLAEAYAARGGGRLWYWGQVLSCLLVRVSPHRRLIPDLVQDAHHTFRLMRRNPGYAAASMICLALGIGVNTTVFSVLDGMFLRRLPVPEPDRVATLDREGYWTCSLGEYFDLKQALPAFEGLAALVPRGTYLDVDQANDQVSIETVTANYAEVLRTEPQLGRWFLPREERPGGGFPVVLSDRIWERHFARNPDVLGRTVRIENTVYEVVGIAAAAFQGVSLPAAIDAWVPLASFPLNRAQSDSTTDLAGPSVRVIGRLARGVPVRAAQAQVSVADERLRAAAGADPRQRSPLKVNPVSGYASQSARRRVAPIAALLAGVMAIVLLIACVNVANLLLSRAVVRQREMMVRLALGASRSRLIRAGLTEGCMLAMGGGALGLVLGVWTNRALAVWLPAAYPQMRGLFLDVNWRVGAMTVLVSLVCALLFSVAPAIDNARAAFPSARRRDLYSAVQVALSLVLLVSAGLLLRGLQRVESLDPGFATERRMYVRLFTPQPDFSPETSMQLFSSLVERAQELPGVRDATLSFAVLGFGEDECTSTTASGKTRKSYLNVVEPGYFRLMQTPLLRGRNFSVADTPTTRTAVIVNETMAREWWPGKDAVGQRIWLGCESEFARREAEVIGVARGSKYMQLDEEPAPVFYTYASQFWWNGFFALIVETAGDPTALAPALLQAARSASPKLRIYELNTLTGVVTLSLWHTRFMTQVVAFFSLLAVALATLGLYGVVAYSVAQRTREIGIRMALGAQRGDVQWMVLARTLRVTAIGIAAGLVMSLAGAQLLRRFLHGLSPLDPVAFASAALAWIGIAMLASYVPSRRATRVDPTVALRYE